MENSLIVIGGCVSLTLKQFTQMHQNQLYICNLDEKTNRRIEKLIDHGYDKLSYMIKTKNMITNLLNEGNIDELKRVINDSFLISFK